MQGTAKKSRDMATLEEREREREREIKREGLAPLLFFSNFVIPGRDENLLRLLPELLGDRVQMLQLEGCPLYNAKMLPFCPKGEGGEGGEDSQGERILLRLSDISEN
jgi:hypothetical protein